MTSSEYPIIDTTYRLPQDVRNEYLKGHPYNNLVVTTTHPEFSDAYDPDLKFAVDAVTMYWPGRSPTQHDRNFETITFHNEADETSDAAIAAQTALIREAILGSSISEAALSRVPAQVSAYWESIKQQHIAPILFAESQCARYGLPLALCETSRIQESSVIPVDTRVMHLWYPNYLSPKPVLARLRKVVKNIMEQEVVTQDPNASHA